MAELEKQKELDFERKHQEDLERIRNFRLMDDDFMSKVFEDKACAEFLLKIILERDDLTVQEVHGQHDLKNLQGRSVRLDILAVDYANAPITWRSSAATMEPGPSVHGITAACWTQTSRKKATGTIS